MPEQWKDIKDYEGLYQVSNYGQVKGVLRELMRSDGQYYIIQEKILKPRNNTRGYHIVNLCKNGQAKNYTIHRLVALHFIENLKNKPEINHKNGIKTDNHSLNLEWVTSLENTVHAIKMGLWDYRRENNSQVKLTNFEIKGMRVLLVAGWDRKEIAKIYNVSQQYISAIKCGSRRPDGLLSFRGVA